MIEIGLMSIANSLGFAFFEPFFGYMSDRIGRKKILVGATLITGLVTVLYTKVTSFWHLLPISFVMAATVAGVAATRRALIAEVMVPSKRGKSYGELRALLAVGGVVGPYFGGYLAEITNYMVPFYVSCFIVLLSVVGVLMVKEVRRDDSTRANGVHTKEASAKSKVSVKLVTSGFMVFLIARMLQRFVGFFLGNILPIFAKESEKLQATESQIGLMMSIAGVIRIPFQLVFGGLTDRIGRKPLIALGALFGGLTFFGFLMVSSVPQLYVMRALYGVWGVSYNLAMMVYLIDCVPSEKYGTAMGLYGLSEDVGGMLGPLVIGFFYDNHGFVASIYCVAGSLFLSTATSMISFRRFKPAPNR